MYFTKVTPRRGAWYWGPSRDMCQGWRLQREAMLAADEKSLDDSVAHVEVWRNGMEGPEGPIARYVEGVRVEPRKSKTKPKAKK